MILSNDDNEEIVNAPKVPKANSQDDIFKCPLTNNALLTVWEKVTAVSVYKRRAYFFFWKQSLKQEAFYDYNCTKVLSITT